jgi:hypothetical protein
MAFVGSKGRCISSTRSRVGTELISLGWEQGAGRGAGKGPKVTRKRVMDLLLALI